MPTSERLELLLRRSAGASASEPPIRSSARFEPDRVIWLSGDVLVDAGDCPLEGRMNSSIASSSSPPIVTWPTGAGAGESVKPLSHLRVYAKSARSAER